ncbi:unnamed protein product [Allacma fusca]|uniref:Uncharacterized protein n=1 Tax=Allacma fusca TaxID=39272 RepID=A0A8J2P8M3_9HEXA|nr:unnamed protein product [Allacma fusca]
MNSGNQIAICFISISFPYFNWVSKDRVHAYTEQLQSSICLPKAGNSRRNVTIMLTCMVWSSVLCLAGFRWFFMTFGADIFDFQLLFENSMGHYLFATVFPQWVGDNSWLKPLCQCYIIMTEFYYVIYIHLADWSNVTNSYFGFLITKEFVDVVCHDENLTAQEFLKFYTSFKKVQRCRNKHYSLFIVTIFIVTISYYSVHFTELIDSTGITGQEMNIATRISLLVYIFDVSLFFAMSAKTSIKLTCEDIRKIFKGKLLLEIPTYQLRLILEDIQNGAHCVRYNHLLIFTPGVVGMIVQNVATFAILIIQNN